MASKIKGITVTLYEPVGATGATGDTGGVEYDPFGAPIYQESPVKVDNVLVQPTSSQEKTDSINLYGREAVYTLAIPKGDTHSWENRRVNINGVDYRVFGIPLEGIECDIPLDWNKKVTVAVYE